MDSDKPEKIWLADAIRDKQETRVNSAARRKESNGHKAKHKRRLDNSY